MIRARLLVPVLASLCAHASAQSKVWVVGPGQANTQIQPAIDQASDGDTVLVKSGSYNAFTIDDKSVDVVADNGANVNLTGTVRVKNIASTRAVVLLGVRVQGSSGGALGTGNALELVNDSGSVRIESCTLLAATAYASGSGARVDTCTDVSLTRCSLFGGNSIGALGIGHGLFQKSSRVASYDSAFFGGLGANGGCNCQGFPAGDGARIEGTGFFFASNSHFQGGRGGNADNGCLGCGCGANGGVGGDGLHAIAPTPVRLLGNVWTGGIGGLGACGGCAPCNPGAPGLPVNALNSTTLGGSPRTLTAENPVRELASFTLTATGDLGDDVYVWVTPETKFRWVPTYRGVQLDRVTGPPRYLGQIGASGSVSRTFAWDDLGAGVECDNVFLQAAMRDSSGSYTFSSSVSMVVLDRAF